MSDPWVKKYLHKKVIEMLQTYGFEYMKMDYNDTIGLGCDGAESLGEGLRKNQEESVNFVRQVKEEVPGIILENCASGGKLHRSSVTEKVTAGDLRFSATVIRKAIRR